MFRLIGIIIGVVATIVVLAAILDKPTRERAGALAIDLTTTVLDAAERLGRKHDTGDVDRDTAPPSAQGASRASAETASAREMPFPVAAVSESTGTGTDERAGADMTLTSPVDPGAQSAPSPEWQESPMPEAVTARADADDSNVKALNWEPVWWAFRSEISAKGFAGYLKHLTGHEYRVRRTSPWAYQVELPYVDEGQRDAVLREIQGKTGLGLGEAPR